MGLYHDNAEDGYSGHAWCPWCESNRPEFEEPAGKMICRHCWKHDLCSQGLHPDSELTFYGRDPNRGVDVHYCAVCGNRHEIPYSSEEAA